MLVENHNLLFMLKRSTPSPHAFPFLRFFSSILLSTSYKWISGHSHTTERWLTISSEKHCWVVVMCLESAAEWALPAVRRNHKASERKKKKTTTVSQAIFILLNHSHRFEVTGFIDSGEARWLQPIRAFHMGRNQRRKKKTACTHSHHQRASSAECTISLLVSSALATTLS